jgi:hypothetical protein
MLRNISTKYDYILFEEFSYGFFGTICLALAIIVHINNNPDIYIAAFDSVLLSLGLIKEDTYLPLYTPLEHIKNSKNKHITLNVPSINKPIKEIKDVIIEDV